jgi:hypothetical protein
VIIKRTVDHASIKATMGNLLATLPRPNGCPNYPDVDDAEVIEDEG